MRILFILVVIYVVKTTALYSFHERISKNKCADGATCDDSQTCCLGKSGEFGCCQMPRATCCKDMEHCCPHGFNCDVVNKKCTPKIVKQDRHVKMIHFMTSTEAYNTTNVDADYNKCADGHACNDTQTCCLGKSGGYGCCPMPSATCCKDMEHCCPHGFDCDIVNNKCIPKKVRQTRPVEMISFMTSVEAYNTTNVDADYNKCADGHACNDTQTCCLGKSGGYGCCPMPSATCCKDMEHCCPHGFDCDIVNNKCIPKKVRQTRPVEMISFMTSVEAYNTTNVDADYNKCADGHACNDTQTCCLGKSGGYGCCPMPSATCCKDMEHCCPHGFDCDIVNNKCIPKKVRQTRPVEMISFMTSVEAYNTTNVDADYNKCADGHACNDTQTCCLGKSGGYGCCPMPSATCCKDMEHCCPHGFDCDIVNNKCIPKKVRQTRPVEMISFMTSVEAYNTTNVDADKNKCEDGHACEDSQTCCLGKSGGYGCCPMPSATCCKDMEHCCPHGFACDVVKNKCIPKKVRQDRPVEMINFGTSRKAYNTTNVDADYNKCADGHACNDTQTCCLGKSGGYGCCPMPSATCCKDMEHCCPHGFDCDIVNNKCIPKKVRQTRPVEMISFMTSVEAYNTTNVDADKNKCEDGHACEDSQTCCLGKSGGYGCCPMPSATCCKDMEHCCPHGFACDVVKNKCIPKKVRQDRPVEMINFGTSRKAYNTTNVDADKNKCADGHACEDSQTCCLGKSGGYGCCPMPSATCCKDMEHCCPHGFYCDVVNNKCIPKEVGHDEPVKIIDIVTSESDRVNTPVSCPDGRKCLANTTCCQMPSNNFGCCPFQSGVCCSDKEHCCPQHYRCDLEDNRCISNKLGLYFFKRLTPIQREVETNVKEVKAEEKPDQPKCKSEHHPLCTLNNGNHSCCPFIHGLCCPFIDSCCPSGTMLCLKNGNCLTKPLLNYQFIMKGAPIKT